MMIEREARLENGRSPLTLTVADGLFLLLLLAGFILRLPGLGEQPLSPAEAEAAWATWAFWQPDSVILADGSPLYFSLTRLLTPILGFGDGVMRLIPALFGLGVVTLPWLWRNQLGTVGALTLSLFLVVSPLQVVVSRTVGGESTAVFCTLLLLIATFRFLESRQRGWLYTAVIAFALGLNSSPLFYSSLLTLLAAWAIHRTFGGSLLGEADAPITIEPTVRRTAVILGALLFVAVSTLFLWNPAGVGTAVRLPAAWLSQFDIGQFSDVGAPFLSFFRYQPGLVLLGFVGMGWATWRNQPLGSFCIYWFAAIILLALLQPGEQSLALIMVLPMGVVAALMINNYLFAVWDVTSGLVCAGVFLLLMLIWVNLARFLRTVTFNAEDLLNLWVILFAIVLAGLALFMLTSTATAQVLEGSLAALLFFFAFYGWGTAWWLGHEGFNDTRERWVTQGTDDDARLLVSVIDEISTQLSNSKSDLDILSRVDTAVLRWYLREYDELTFAEALPPTAVNAVIITSTDTELALTLDYMGSDYGLLRREPEQITSDTPLIDTLRWWLFQETPTPLIEERVILWLRSDLAVERP